jgi:hypothetical protein
MSSSLVTALTTVVLGALLAPGVARDHGGGTEAEAMVAQPARTLAQQALAELRVRDDVKDAAKRLDAALESKDTNGIDVGVLRRAMETVDAGDPKAAIPRLDQALSRPLGATSGKALHEAGRESQPATGRRRSSASPSAWRCSR